ncbi:MAG: DUF2281 domain-containing protein [Bacteroidetes bacterium]|nr:DUF2281 domain-containing protein [Bacteroidota bacterium]
MSALEKYKIELTEALTNLPEEKVVELIDFVRFLDNQYSRKSKSAVDKNFLILQQKSLGKIWDNPEEDVYEL